MRPGGWLEGTGKRGRAVAIPLARLAWTDAEGGRPISEAPIELSLGLALRLRKQELRRDDPLHVRCDVTGDTPNRAWSTMRWQPDGLQDVCKMRICGRIDEASLLATSKTKLAERVGFEPTVRTTVFEFYQVSCRPVVPSG